MNTHQVLFTNTVNGKAAFGAVVNETVHMPELTHYGYDGGTNYTKANKTYRRELVRKAKAAVGLTGVRGDTEWFGDTCEFRPHGSKTVVYID